MENQELVLFVGRDHENECAHRLLRMSGLEVSVVPHPPYNNTAPELQIGADYNGRIRGFRKIKEWLDSQSKKAT